VTAPSPIARQMQPHLATLPRKGAASQAAWYIDPLTGNDGNPGTLAAPLATLTEWAARIGQQPIAVPMTVNVRSSLLSDDTPMGPVNVAPGASLLIQGVRTTITATSFSAVTASAPVANTPWQGTAAAVNWIAAIAAGYRVRMTAGPSADAIAWPVKNLGAGACRFSAPASADYTLGPFGQSQMSLTTDAFVLEDVTSLGSFALAVNVGAGGSFSVVDCRITGGSFDADNVLGLSSLYGCPLAGAVSERGANYINCGSTGAQAHPIGTNLLFMAGATIGDVAVGPGGYAIFDLDAMIQTGSLQLFGSGLFILSAVQLFDWGAGLNGGVYAWQFATPEVFSFLAPSKQVWGVSAVAGSRGWRIQQQAFVAYDVDTSGLTLTGAAGALLLGSQGTALAYGDLPYMLGGQPTAKITAADQSNITAVLADEASLQEHVAAQEAVEIEWRLATTFGAADGCLLKVVGPAGAVGWCSYEYATSPAGVVSRFSQVLGTGGVGINAGDTAAMWVVRASIQTGATAGTVKIQFSQQAHADATATKILAASGMVSTRVDPAAESSGMVLL
jgi:hypothetical protein